ncbi:flagellar basal-body rod protein FlgC [Herbaspirillum rubrisubalbicans]|uniref:flagellar basal body rod protein FlgC n=1 Tax=Herbaspirillum rubrisubalbicans TaxID=80842 RepID=UPI000DC547A7|nr:flagellar basal body rod protein FlgC [Herbaspirillum rubrisubalbicans]RAN48432.1 flagellar basal-body rod protein FlgC [Herbaspirillum rubrisubalbicans]
MDYAKSFAISAAGMDIERTRVDVAALNLANANTVQTPDGLAYRPLTVLARLSPASAPAGFSDQIDQGVDRAMLMLPQTEVVPALSKPRSVYEPGNPLADAKGFISYPGVDIATETVTMMNAQRSYEANVAAMNVTRTLALKALDIGG